MGTIYIQQTNVPRDGTTDSMGAIQNIIDHAPTGSKIVFERGMTYLVGRNPNRPWNETHIQVPKKLWIDGNSCRFLLGSEIHGSWAAVFRFDSPVRLLGRWRETIQAGDRTFHIGAIAKRLRTKSRVFFMLGECQYDTYNGGDSAGEDGLPDWAGQAIVTAVGSDYITVNTGPDFNVRSGTVDHLIYVASSWPNGSIIENATFELLTNVEDKTAFAIRIQRADNIIIRNISVIGNAVAIYWAKGLKIDGLNVQTTSRTNGLSVGAAFGGGDIQADVGRLNWCDVVCDDRFESQPIICEGRCNIRLRSATWARTGSPLRGHHIYAVAGNSQLQVDQHTFANWAEHPLVYLEPNSPAVAILP